MKTIGQEITGMFSRGDLPEVVQDLDNGRVLEWDASAAGFSWRGFVVHAWYIRERPLRFVPYRVARQEALAI